MGLLKTGLKAVVAVKTADVIHERVLERQQAHASAHGYAQPAAAEHAGSAAIPAAGAQAAISPASPPAPASPDMAEKLAQLQQLGDLRAAGVLTDAEFETQKANILSA
ncbi:MAG: SHOCT domain-containing protein [Solirubrobacterales bacterium]|nr:SHOCT domain-containing protein [Solirubrobacterales bacterium]